MTCGARHSKTGSVCELEYPHADKPHRLSNCNARLTIEWGDDEIAPSPWNEPLEPILLKKAS